MKNYVIALILAFAGIVPASAQSNVGINITNPDASAALDVTSTSQGMLVPRMTLAQRGQINLVNNVSTPATGLLIYQTDNTPGFYYYNGSSWRPVSGSSGPGSQLYATSTLAQSKTMYGFSRYTFNFDNVVTGQSAAASAWSGNNTYTVPAGAGGLYQINLAILMTAYSYSTPPQIYPEIQVTSGSAVTYYYGVAGSSALLAGSATDATSAQNSGAPFSYGRSAANVTLPLAAGDVVRVYIRSSLNATSSTHSASFSTDGSTWLNILRLN